MAGLVPAIPTLSTPLEAILTVLEQAARSGC
jgi:hypothetical protein